MRYLDLTLPTPHENLACDEALLELCEDGGPPALLRFWEPREHFVVLGYSSRLATDVKPVPRDQGRVPILRRCSGGGTVLQGPGCLNFSLILRLDGTAPLRTITSTTAWIMERHRAALEQACGRTITFQGLSDLVIGTQKFSGNAQRRKRRGMLFHGTFLLEFDIPLVERLLAMPPRQPAYRRDRSHQAFLTNLRIPARTVKRALAAAWQATESVREIPTERITRLARDIYTAEAWTKKF